MTSDSESRVTRSKRSLGFAIALFAGCVVAVTGLGAQETPAPVPKAPAATPANAPASTAPEAAVPPVETGNTPASAPASGSPGAQAPSVPQPADAKSPPAGASRSTTSGGSKDHFEPTEKVRADFEVSFPVDI
jgi:hypothetical protein